MKTQVRKINVLMLEGEFILIYPSLLVQPAKLTWLTLSNTELWRWRKEAWRTHLWLEMKWKPSQCKLWFRSSQELKVNTHFDPTAEAPHAYLALCNFTLGPLTNFSCRGEIFCLTFMHLVFALCCTSPPPCVTAVVFINHSKKGILYI